MSESLDDKLALAYFKECGQLASDADWIKGIFLDSQQPPSDFILEVAVETIGKGILESRRIMRGEAKGKPDIIAKVKTLV